MKLGLRSQKSGVRIRGKRPFAFTEHRSQKQESGGGKFIASYLLSIACCLLPVVSYPSPLSAKSPQRSSCQTQDIKTLTAQLLRDLPGYANRVIQRSRRLSRTNDVYGYVLVAGHPEFAPLTLGPGVYAPTPPDSEAVQQVFFTTLERRYTDDKPIELQDFHWLFLTKTKSGWRLATMFSQTGGYPTKQPPTRPRESSNGVIAQAIEAWLRDCQAETVLRH